MITRIELTNFMSHDHTVLELAAGLTVLVGPNNCGKSAVIAALQILSSNENSTYVMRHGARECSVKVETDDGHTIEWRRKNAPSYVVDGRVFDRLRGSGLPDELHAALRLPKVDGGDNTDFDVHFGTQKSPIFLVGGSAANAARFFASSSDAIRLVAMQKRHKEKLLAAQRDKSRLEAEAKQVNSALGALEPVVDLEKRLTAASDLFDGINEITECVAAAEKTEAALFAQLNAVLAYAARIEALRALSPPPPLVPTERLQEQIRQTVAAESRLLSAAQRVDVLLALPPPPSLSPPAPLQSLIRATDLEEARRDKEESRTRTLVALPSPPRLSDISPLRQWIASAVRLMTANERAQGESLSFSCLASPPLLAEVGPVESLAARLDSCGQETYLASRRKALFAKVSPPPELQDERELTALLLAMTKAVRQMRSWQRAAATLGRIAPVPPLLEHEGLRNLIERLDAAAMDVRKGEAASLEAAADAAKAEAGLRARVEGNLCPICGNLLDADRVVKQAASGAGGGGHGHG